MAGSKPKDMADMMQMMAALGLSPQEMTEIMRSGDAASIIQSRTGRAPSTRKPYEDPDDIAADIKAEIEYVQENFERERTMQPQRIVGAPRSMMLDAWSETLKSQSRMHMKGSVMRKAYVGSQKNLSVAPLSSLHKMYFNEMLAPFVHKGNYILCRVVTVPNLKIGLEFMAEDQNGDIKHVVLYCLPFLTVLHQDDIDVFVPVGTPVFIREPFLKYPLHGGPPFIRVDSPSDVTFPHPDDSMLRGNWKYALPKSLKKLPSSSVEWKELGNRLFGKERYRLAAIAYTKGLASASDTAALLANRAQAYLKLGWALPALTDATAVIAIDEISAELRRKAQLRAGAAQYQRGKYGNARAFFEDAFEEGADSALCKEWLGKCADRLREASGDFNWLRMFCLAQTSAKSIDAADFVGPIRVAMLSPAEGGRGMVAARDVKAGELLVVSKPFVAATNDDIPKDTVTKMVNLITKRGSSETQFIAIQRAVDKMYGDADLHGLVTQLCPAPPYPSPTSPYSTPSQASEICGDILRPCTDIDVGLIESIYTNNAFELFSTMTYSDFKPQQREKKNGSALYLLPSLFNHSCVPNADIQTYAEVMVIRALVDIPAGDQIFVMYASPEESDERRDGAFKTWNMTCDCIVCKGFRSEAPTTQERRGMLLKKWDAESSTLIQRSDVRGIRKMLESLQQACPAGNIGALRSLSPIYHVLATCLQKMAGQIGGPGPRSDKLYYEAITAEIQALESVGFVVIDKSIQDPSSSRAHARKELPIEQRVPETAAGAGPMYILICVMIVACFVSMGDEGRAERWLRASCGQCIHRRRTTALRRASQEDIGQYGDC